MKEIVITELYDPDSPIYHVESLAFNRATGSIGETKALFYIENQLKTAQIGTKVQYFSYVPPFRLLMRIIYLILFSYLILYRLIIVIAFYFAIKYLFATTRNFTLVQKENSKNLLATISAKKNQLKRPVVIITAHYDSFSANIPHWLQSILFFIFKIIFVPYFAFNLIFLIWILIKTSLAQGDTQLYSNLVIIFSFTEFVVTSLIFLLIYNTKKSKGSIDNASGVAILIELAKLLKNNPLNNIDIITLFTGAEEWGLIGSKRYCKRNRKFLSEEYDLDNSLNINIDMVGSYIGLIEKKHIVRKKRLKKPIHEEIEEIARELNIQIEKHRKVLDPKSDHRTFKKFARKTKSSFQVACFHSDKDSKYIHSRRDTPDKCSSVNLNNAVNLIYLTLNKLDSQT